MQKQQFRKRHFTVPANFPAAVTFERDNVNLDLVVADQASYDAFRMNVRNIDPGALQARKQELGETPFKAEDFAASLKEGAEYFAGYKPDGALDTCYRCSKTFQPVSLPYERDGEKMEGGNFLILKAAQFVDMVGLLPADLKTRVEQLATDATNTVMNGKAVPSHAVVLPVCKDCREHRAKTREREHVFPVWERYYSRASAASALPTIDQKIGAAENTRAIANALDLAGSRPQRRAVSAGPSAYKGDRKREQKPHRDWRGADLEVGTADALDQAGYTSLTDAIAAAESGELLEKGIAHPGSIGPIKFALKRAVEGRQVVGNTKSATRLASMPGATPVAKGKDQAKRPKEMKISADRVRKGGSVPMDALR